MLSKSFSNAFTLIELLATLTVLVISLFFLSPVIFKLNDHLALNSEIENLRSFFQQINTKARSRKENYTLVVSQNNTKKYWCIVAIKSDGEGGDKFVCDCLKQNHCSQYKNVEFYHSHYLGTEIVTSNYYPNEFNQIDGNNGRNSDLCFNLKKGNITKTLQKDVIGGVHFANKNSKCN